MRVRNFLLADAVDVGQDGKLFVHGGGLSQIRGMPSFPWTQPRLGVLVTLEREDEEFGSDHLFQLRLYTPGGDTVGPELEAPFRIPRPDPPDALAQVNLSMSLTGVTFPEAGIYSVEAWVDGERIAQLPLAIRE